MLFFLPTFGGNMQSRILSVNPNGRLACFLAFNLVFTATAGSFCLSAEPMLVPADNGTSFDFETPDLQGTIRTDGPYHGVSRLVDKRTGKQVIDPRYSALNLFRLFSVNQGMGMPRMMERTVQATPQSVEIKWAATDAHQGEITARYEVREPNAVDLTVTIRSKGAYSGYELFMSSYFDKLLRPHVFLQPVGRGALNPEPQWVLPMVNDAFRGTVLVFPRDSHSARRCVDGRWERNEFGAPTVQMCPVRHYARCLAVLTDADKQSAVVLMAQPTECYAISTRYHADEEADRLTPYSAFDLSLFGHDLLPDDVRTAKVRLTVAPLDSTMSQPLKLYEAFLAETKSKGGLP
jgi:hypothetical protein